MFSVGRILTIAIVAAAVYFGFYAVPPGDWGEGRFTPQAVAEHEIQVWKAMQARETYGTYTNVVLMLREQYRYSWFRAAQAGFYTTRALTTFAELRGRYERVLPDLEDAAIIEKDWMGAAFDPAAVARAQLTAWVTRRLPNLNSVDQVAPLIADEYTLRYRIGTGQAMDAAMRRAEVEQQFDQAGADPNWPVMTKVLTESYRSLQVALLSPRRPK